LSMDQSLSSLVAGGADEAGLAKAAKQSGMSSLTDDGLQKLLTGATSPAELLAAVTIL